MQEVTIETEPGAVYEFTDRRVDVKLAATSLRVEPRRILITEVENVGLNYCPQYPPFGQIIRDEYVHLGRPLSYGSPRPDPDAATLLTSTKSAKWENRQDAALQLARVKPAPRVHSAMLMWPRPIVLGF